MCLITHHPRDLYLSWCDIRQCHICNIITLISFKRSKILELTYMMHSLRQHLFFFLVRWEMYLHRGIFHGNESRTAYSNTFTLLSFSTHFRVQQTITKVLVFFRRGRACCNAARSILLRWEKVGIYNTTGCNITYQVHRAAVLWDRMPLMTKVGLGCLKIWDQAAGRKRGQSRVGTANLI